MKSYAVWALISALTLMFPSLMRAKDYQLIGDSTVPAAAEKVSVDKDRNGNHKMKVEVHHLAQPDALTPPGKGMLSGSKEETESP
jgi:hypothetical protein